MRIRAVDCCSKLKRILKIKPQLQGFIAHCSSQQQAKPGRPHVRCSRQEVLTAVLQLAAGQQQSAVASEKQARAQSCTSLSTRQLLTCVMQLCRPLMAKAACRCDLARGAKMYWPTP